MKFILFGTFCAIYLSVSCVSGVLSNSKCGSWMQDKMVKMDGSLAEPDQYLWIALLQYKTDRGDQYGCGGVLINDRYVLTTATCLTNPSKKLIHVHLGESNLASTRICFSNPKHPDCKNIIVTGVDKKIPHQKYGSGDISKSYDIGLIKLDRSVGDWKPICLPNDKPPLIKFFFTAGWGNDINFEYTRFISRRLTKNLRSFDKNECATELNMMYLQDDLSCIRAKNVKLASIGDAGGPLMTYNMDHKIMVAGIIHSTGHISRERSNKPIVYTNVTQYVDWIKSNVL